MIPQTDFCHRCIDRRIAQAVCILRAVSSEKNGITQRKHLDDLISQRMKLNAEQEQFAPSHDRESSNENATF